MTAALAAAADFPRAGITNGLIEAGLYLPDAQQGYYRGTRFDWSGQIYSLKYKDHQYFGQWFPRYDPKLHDSILGPVEEYKTGDSALGYADAKPGGTFVRIGVGVVRKPEERAFQSFRTYDIVDPGKWKIRQKGDSIEFTHELRDQTGYAYVYRKTVRLVKGKPEMVLEHSLKNTGRKPIETSQYNHNFFMFDQQPTGPDTILEFPFELKPTRSLGQMAEVKGKSIVYLQELKPGQSVFTELQGFGPTARDYDIRLGNRKAGAAVRIRGDLPLEKIVFWSIKTTACPEPYVHMRVEPGRESKWKITYELQTLQ